MGQPSQLIIFTLIQAIALLFALASWWLAVLPWWLPCILFAVLVILGSWRWHDGYWWLFIHLFFPILVFFALQLQIEPFWYLFAFGLCWLVFGHVSRSRVPLYLSNEKALVQLEKLLPQGATFLDIGGGTGTVLAWLAKRRPDLRLAGVELAWLPWLIGRLRLAKKVAWWRADFSTLDLNCYDVTYAFLSPVPMSDLWAQARAQMRPGTLFVSNTFVVPGIAADKVIELDDWKGGKLLIWQM